MSGHSFVMVTLLAVLLFAGVALGAGEVVRGQCRRMLLAPVLDARLAQRREARQADLQRQ